MLGGDRTEPAIKGQNGSRKKGEEPQSTAMRAQGKEGCRESVSRLVQRGEPPLKERMSNKKGGFGLSAEKGALRERGGGSKGGEKYACIT